MGRQFNRWIFVASLLIVATFARAANLKTELPHDRIAVAVNQGFCTGGVFPATKSAGGEPAGIQTWGSYCQNRERDTGSLTTTVFRAPRVLRLYLAGYDTNPGVRLEVERIADGAALAIRPVRDAGENWVLHEFTLPSSWLNSSIRLKATDNATGPGGWLAFSESVTANRDTGFRDALDILLRTLIHFVLIFLPCFAVCAIFAHRRLRSPFMLGLIALSVTGASGYLIFWLYFWNPRIGHAVAFVLPVASLAYLVWIWNKLPAEARSSLAKLIVPVGLAGTAALLVLSTGFLYGGVQNPLFTPTVRFSHPLPFDNSLPYVLAEGLQAEFVAKPMAMDWLSSDRPPLQTGIVLSQYPFMPRPRDFGYTVVSVIAQSFWVFGFWLLLTALRLNPRAIALALVTSLLTGFVFLNSFFVWPKLLAAAYIVGFLATLVYALIERPSRDRALLSVVSAALLAWGMLSHGGSAFAVIGIAIVSLPLIRRVSPKHVAAVLGLTVILYLPWMGYQKFFDPPGNRMLKYHLAGEMAVDQRPFGATVVAAYTQLSFKQVLAYKLANFDAAAGRGFDYCTHLPLLIEDLISPRAKGAELAQLAGGLRGENFFFLWACLGCLIIGPFLLMAGFSRRFRTREWKAALLFWILTAVIIIPWCLLMFGRPTTTVMHAGTYVTVLLALAGSVLACWAVSPALACAVCVLQVALNFLLYGVLMRAAGPDVPLAEGYLRPAMLVLCVLALAGTLCLTGLLARSNESVHRCALSKPARASGRALAVKPMLP